MGDSVALEVCGDGVVVDAEELGDRPERLSGLIVADDSGDLCAAEATLHWSGSGV